MSLVLLAFLLGLALALEADVSAARRLLLALGSGGSGHTVPPNILFALYNGNAGTPNEYAIGAATFDGSAWTEFGSNPVLVKGSGGAWDDTHVKDPMLLWDGSQYVMYYAGHDGTKFQVGRATASSHEGTWTKDAANPVVPVGSGGSFDDSGVAFPTVRYDPDESPPWQMWYRSDDGALQEIAYADSPDGVTWTKHGVVLGVGAGGTWEDEGVLPAAVYKTGATYYLFYGGRQGTTTPRWQGGIATFTDPTGTYTKDAGNPTLLARFNDSGTSASLTGNATASAVVAIADTAPFNVGEPVIIVDLDTETEVHRIESIDSGTQLTLESATTGAFTTAQLALLRPLAWNAVLPRTVRALTGASGYEMFFTPFQPVEDLTVPGNTLWEGSMRATATSLTGPWSYDYDTGLVVPLGVEGAAWDSVSAENPSVIRAP